jgi:hypothetical protein
MSEDVPFPFSHIQVSVNEDRGNVAARQGNSISCEAGAETNRSCRCEAELHIFEMRKRAWLWNVLKNMTRWKKLASPGKETSEAAELAE